MNITHLEKPLLSPPSRSLLAVIMSDDTKLDLITMGRFSGDLYSNDGESSFGKVLEPNHLHVKNVLHFFHMNQATQNITLALPKETLRQVKIIAAKRDTSVSALLKEKLEDLVHEESDYEQAHREFMEVVDRGFDLGTYGKITWTRDEAHER